MANLSPKDIFPTPAGIEMGGQHTLGHIDCPECARVRNEQAMHTGNFGSYLFPQAAQIWLSFKSASISAGMLKDYRDCIKALTHFFAFMPLNSIHLGHVQVYQRSRQVRVGATRINKELVTLGQILAVAGKWADIKKYYKPLPIPLSIGVALEPEEEEYLFQLAKKKSRWLVCYCASLIENGTCAGPGEIRHLKLADISLKKGHEVILVRRALKNRYRQRALPLEGDSLWAVEQLVERYRAACKKHGVAESPDHYLLYHRAPYGKRNGRKPNPGGTPGATEEARKLSWEARTCPHCGGRFLSKARLVGHIRADHPEVKLEEEPTPSRIPDFHRPMGVWRTAWESLRAELAKKYPHLATLRRYDLRHNACTKMLEEGVPEKVVEEQMGHKINSQIKDRYSHIRMQAKRKAAKILNAGHVARSEQTPRPPEPPPPPAPAPELRPVESCRPSVFEVVNGGKVVTLPVRKPWR